MSFPAQTTGIGVAAKILVEGNVPETPANKRDVPGYNDVFLSLSGTDGPTTFQLNPEIVDAAGNPVELGTVFTLSAVAASAPGVLTLTAVDDAGNFTGTITGGASNAYVGKSFTIAGFANVENNNTFIATASSATVLTLKATTIAETHAATATPLEGTAVYTGTITGGATNAFAGETFDVAGFTGANNNGTFIATASSATTLTLENAVATAETHAATATAQESLGNELTYVADGAASYASGTSFPSPAPSENPTKVVTVSATGLITAVTAGGSVVEVSYPTFNNLSGDTGAISPNPATGLPLNKIYAEVNVTVGP